MGGHTLETERLLLRPFRETVRDGLYELLSQLEDDEFEGYPGITYENCAEHLRRRIESKEFLAMELKGSGRVIGNIYCGDRDYQAKEVGFIVNQRFQRCGFAQEALTAVVEDAFRHGAHRIYAECDPQNERSWRLLESAGFLREAHLRQNTFFHRDDQGNPIWKDTFIYAVLND